MIKKLIYKIFVNKIAASSITPSNLRKKIYNNFGMEIDGVVFSKCYFEKKLIKVGKGSFINKRCKFDNNVEVIIGENCAIGHEVMFCTSTHEIGNHIKRASKVLDERITVGNGSWIGARSTILSGVTIGNGVVIGAGSLVIKDCDDNCLYAGVPAKKIKKIS